MRHVISALVVNEPGVLANVAGKFEMANSAPVFQEVFTTGETGKLAGFQFEGGPFFFEVLG